jgi:hypothetical protein
MLHRKILRDVRAHAVPEQDNGCAGILIADHVVYQQPVIRE